MPNRGRLKVLWEARHHRRGQKKTPVFRRFKQDAGHKPNSQKVENQTIKPPALTEPYETADEKYIKDRKKKKKKKKKKR